MTPPTVLVAGELRRAGRPAIGCPAAVLLEGELRRAGLSTVRGPVYLGAGGERAHTAVFPATGGPAGLGVVAMDDSRVRAAMDTWIAVTGPARTVLLAVPRSFCAGVEWAIEVVEQALSKRGGPVYVPRQIVHNTHVLAQLAARGAVVVDELDAVPDGATVVLSAHGVSPAVRGEALRRGLEVIDATCPLVARAHSEARRAAGRGDTAVPAGRSARERGGVTPGEAAVRAALVRGTAAEAGSPRAGDTRRVAYLAPGALTVGEPAGPVRAPRDGVPALRGPATGDVCYAAANRHDALSSIADESDLVLVVGARDSPSSQQLVELVRRQGTPAHLVGAPGEVRATWLGNSRVIGLTTGASAPPHLVADVVAAIGGLGPLTVTERMLAHTDARLTAMAAAVPAATTAAP